MNRNHRIIATLNLVLLLNIQVLYSQAQFRETVWIQSNRDVFITGEDVTFKAVLLENDSYQPSVLSKNVRVELIDESGNNIIHQNKELKDSKLSGKITLPNNLTTGWYYIRAYSNWMRNFGESYFTTLPIRVLNPEDINRDSLYYNNENLKLRILLHNDPITTDKKHCSIFASNQFDEAIAAHGFILSGPGDTVLHFNTNRTGWATSFYNEASEKRYQVFAEGYMKENIEFEIVESSSISSNVKISVEEKYGYLKINLENLNSSDPYKLLVHRLYSWSWFHSATPENNKLTFHIPIRDLPTGLSQIAIFDSENKLIFKQLWSDYDEVSGSIRLEMDTSKLSVGNECVFEYYSAGYFENSQLNEFSLITDKFIPQTRMYNYLPGLPGWPAKTEIPINQDAFNAWIAANSYPDEISESFFLADKNLPNIPDFETDKDKSIKHHPETRGGILDGRIYNSNTGDAVTYGDIALTILNDNSFYATKTDNEGKFVFSFPDQYGFRDYLMNYIDEYNPLWQLEIQPDYALVTVKYKKNRAFFTREELKFLTDQSLKIQLRNIYYPETSSNNLLRTDSIPQQEMFFGKPDASRRIDNFIRLSNLREIFFEVIPFVNVRLRNKKYEIYAVGDNLYPSSYPALVLFDGIPIYEYEDLLNLPPDRIEVIEAKTEFYIHGNAIFRGIVNIRSKKNDFGGLSIPQTAIVSTLQLPDSYKYQTIRARKSEGVSHPSIDDILLWESVNGTTNGKNGFFMNDNPGRYILSVYGFDKDGKWHYGQKIFNVYEPLDN